MSAKKIRMTRIPFEIKQLMESRKKHGIECTINSDDYSQLLAFVDGPPNTAYGDDKFKLEIKIGEKYPFQPPTFKFLTPIFHPNIDASGNICLDLLRMPPTGTYNPTITLESILVSIRLLLAHPNPDDPLNFEAAELFRNQDSFTKAVKSHAEKYYMKQQPVFPPDINTSTGCENKDTNIDVPMDIDLP